MYFSVTEVKALEDYKLHLKFKNGKEKVFDMKPYLQTGIFKELNNEKLFKTVHISFDTVQWDNEADIDPETLYKDSIVLQHA